MSLTISLASNHLPWHPKQCTYAPHITVLGLLMDGFGDFSISDHTASASAYRPARSAADTRCVYVYESALRCAAFNSRATSLAPSQSPFLAYPPSKQLYEYVVTTSPGEASIRLNCALACAMSSARPAMTITWWHRRSSAATLYTSTRRLASALASRHRRAPSNAASVRPAVMASGTTPGSSRIARNTSPASSHRCDSRSTVKIAVYTNMFRGSPMDARSFHTWYAAGQFSHRPSAVIAADATSLLITSGSKSRR
mmetsp:Transcript_9557/g.37253  ORF Transcript_9557/g.37253 Transcript_9557/m.37253 type:complete len:255 (-) Transcript_9557:1146-1910(-)